ncbi:MAG: DnaA regulatory inactivator Hda [Gammaproteobacteria bacterium]|nr:DnaA regulatory inactivator Hda [Gammaproteobacteria bacterium]MDA7972469.1 DnaA regulatory inactivator Hda [Gammaproteobacteria bacterium]
MSRQTLIPAPSESESSFASFYAGENAALLEELRRISRGARAVRVLYFWGDAGSGKSHLLHACCRHARALRRPHAYWPAAGAPPDAAQADPRALVCIDDFHAAAADDAWQAALLGLYEKLRLHGGLVVAADRPVNELQLRLKDLESRLLSGGVIRMRRLSERDRLAALRARARSKGFELSDQALHFMLARHSRDTASLFSLLERIDSASLAAQRKITVPFIKSLL